MSIIRMETVYRDAENNIQGGVDFYLPEGSSVVMYEVWEHTASGRIWHGVCPDPIGSQGLLEYFLSTWQGKRRDPYTDEIVRYEIKDVDANYR